MKREAVVWMLKVSWVKKIPEPGISALLGSLLSDLSPTCPPPPTRHHPAFGFALHTYTENWLHSLISSPKLHPLPLFLPCAQGGKRNTTDQKPQILHVACKLYFRTFQKSQHIPLTHQHTLFYRKKNIYIFVVPWIHAVLYFCFFAHIIFSYAIVFFKVLPFVIWVAPWINRMFLEKISTAIDNVEFWLQLPIANICV